MQTTEEKNNARWARCPRCGHKLFRTYDDTDLSNIEIKCHSCKRIVRFVHAEGENLPIAAFQIE